MKRKLIIGILLVGLLVLSLTTVASADPGSQTWYLSNVDGSDYYKTMYKDDTSQSEDTQDIGSNGSLYERSDEAASVDVTFPSGTWTGYIRFDSPVSDGGTFMVFIGHSDGSILTSFISAGSQSFTGNGEDTEFSINLSAASFTVAQGDYLSIRVRNISGSQITVKLGSNFSYINSPTADPGYPVPEMPTVILLSIGLGALAGYFVIRRRRGVGIAKETLP